MSHEFCAITIDSARKIIIEKIWSDEKAKENFREVKREVINPNKFSWGNALIELFDYAPKPIENDNNSTLKKLAWHLAYNYVSISFGDRYKDKDMLDMDKDRIMEMLQTSGFESEIRNCRNLVIVGAGATYDAFRVLPYGKDMLEKLHAHLEGIEGPLFKSDLERFRTYLQNPETFEDGMSFLSKIYSNDTLIKEFLKDYYNIRFRPNLGFEILAHLLKHGFVDGIINFNLDELLDQAIEDEIGSGAYLRVVSEGDCIPLSKIAVDGCIKIPLYIKPHGTASNIDSLNLTAEKYFRIPSGIKELMEQLLNGKMDDDKGGTPTIKTVNLICLGFSMQSDALNSIIKESNSDVEFNIFNFNIADFDKQLKSENIRRRGNVQPDLYENTRKNLIKIEDDIPLKYKVPDLDLNPLSKHLFCLWQEVIALFKTPFQPRDIGGHEILSSIFYDSKYCKEGAEKTLTYTVLKDEINLQYFFDRTLIELAIIICRNKGLIDPKYITLDRFGTYFEKYLELHQEKYTGKEPPFSMYDFFRRIFRMREHMSFSGNVFNLSMFTSTEEDRILKKFPDEISTLLPPPLRETDEDIRHEFRENIPLRVILRLLDGVDKATFLHRYKDIDRDDAPEELSNSILWSKLINNKDKDESLKRIKYLYDHLVTLNKRIFYDICPKFDDRQNFIFDSFDKHLILNTDISMVYEFVRLFRDLDNWDVMIVVSEKGRFVTEFGIPSLIKEGGKNLTEPVRRKLSKKKIINICCHEVLKQACGKLTSQSKDDNVENIYKNKFLKDNLNEKGITCDLDMMEVLSLPYFVYEHHMCFFLKKPDEPLKSNERPSRQHESYKEFLKHKMRGIYYYHKGFMQKINPILFDSQITKEVNSDFFYEQFSNDNKKILETFHALFLKAEAFKINRTNIIKINRPDPDSDPFCKQWNNKICEFLNAIFGFN